MDYIIEDLINKALCFFLGHKIKSSGKLMDYTKGHYIEFLMCDRCKCQHLIDHKSLRK